MSQDVSTQLRPAVPAAHPHSADPQSAHACACGIDRRQLLTRAGGVGLGVAAVAVLAACGAGSDEPPAATAGADGSLAKLADIPVGGALLVTDTTGAKILLVQETAGTVTGLTSVCTHQGCTVAPGNGELDCPCHGSRFDLSGNPISGPAKEPLAAVAVHVDGDAVFSGQA
ncbi:QcrA and Rieske domain-containing protein [Cellulomonas composti]|uniref:Cytochrome bc1 complex Rieske iron-sulfur subunit n=1 Tax=Cellulomonas composti TaxID=266130 RepID=A0A511JDN5_9CELL|nr:Rieske (2Fe-2S) protein [Cellulomonas composti]GEL96056.1 hypothetical protein CCO02nite_27140 [Cellulomonas composti]